MHKWKNTEPNKKKTKTITTALHIALSTNAEKNNSLRRNKNKKKQHMAKYKWKKMEITRVDEAKKRKEKHWQKKRMKLIGECNISFRLMLLCCNLAVKEIFRNEAKQKKMSGNIKWQAKKLLENGCHFNVFKSNLVSFSLQNETLIQCIMCQQICMLTDLARIKH